MNHVFLCREFPPAPYPAGGIGSYVSHITRLLAEHGERVHLIGQRWEGAPKCVEQLCGGRLTVHRIAAEDAELYPSLMSPEIAAREMKAMQASAFPSQWFSWVAAGLVERLVESEAIDAIEAQEWEAPLYYFMLRRSLGLGPKRTPPVITHIHSPTEFIFRSNDWSPARRDYLPMKRLEDHVILSADALLCPSRFLAAQIRRKFGFSEDTPATIPLPLGDTQPIARTPSTWREGSICYFGRLEPRKGVVEFVDAAVEVAHERADVRFSFIGSDTPFSETMGVLEYVQRRIPASMRDRFVFHGVRPRAELLRMLGDARIAVVPSRWENFPNTALEAMCTGLPVLATRNGGMAEMIVAGESGWLVGDDDRPLVARLAESLRCALDTPADVLEEMGSCACASIRRFCQNDAIVDRHLSFRAQVLAAGAVRSTSPPRNLPWSESTVRPVAAPAAREKTRAVVVAVIALAGQDPAPALNSLRAQSFAHSTVLVASQAAGGASVAFAAYAGTSNELARRVALDAPEVKHADAVLFLSAATELTANALETMVCALDHRPEAAIVVPWTNESVALVGETPAFPYQWLADETGRVCLYRMAGIRDAFALNAQAADTWELGAAVMAAGWSALRLPALLANNDVAQEDVRDVSWRRRRLAERHAKVIAHDVASLVTLAPIANAAAEPSGIAREQLDSISALLRTPLREKVRLVVAAGRQPRNSARWLLWRLRSGLTRFGERS